MKKIVAIAVLFAAVMVSTVATPVAASNRYFATGANVRMSLIDTNANCVGDFSYPANTPFYVVHGWDFPGWSTDTVAFQTAAMSPTTYFALKIDGVFQFETMYAHNYQDTKLKFFASENDHGLTGTHVFEGLWYLDNYLDNGGTPGTSVLELDCTSSVTFV